jgi:hypothetical protein
MGVAYAPEAINSIEFLTANSIIDGIFFIDLIFNFRTTYFSVRTGEEIINSKKIAINYLRNSFCIDLLSTIPFDVIIGLTI